MRNYILIVFVLLSTMIFGQDFKVPDSFKYLKMIKIDQDSLVYLFVNNDFKEDIKLSQEFLEDNFTEEFIGITKIDKTKDSEFLISFTLAPSMDLV